MSSDDSLSDDSMSVEMERLRKTLYNTNTEGPSSFLEPIAPMLVPSDKDDKRIIIMVAKYALDKYKDDRVFLIFIFYC